MANKVATAALQYSKRLSKFICWVWALYRFTFLIISAIRPQASSSMAATIQGIDWIMLVNEGTYLINSLGEKYIYSDRFILAWLNKDGYKNLIGKIVKSEDEDFVSDEESNEEPDEELLEEEVSEDTTEEIEEGEEEILDDDLSEEGDNG